MAHHAVVVLGWAGALLLLLGYVQTSRGRWTAGGTVFQASSILGSGATALAAATAAVWSSAALNLAWLLIGVGVLARNYRSQDAVSTSSSARSTCAGRPSRLGVGARTHSRNTCSAVASVTHTSSPGRTSRAASTPRRDAVSS